MDTIEYRNPDLPKADWGDGEWLYEPDKKQWLDPATGYPCLIVRNPDGALCGYVGVPFAHPAFGKPLGDSALSLLRVHGSVNFGSFCNADAPEYAGVCHLVRDEAPVWWLGFDCMHVHDLVPGMEAMLHRLGLPHSLSRRKSYRNFAFVISQVEALAKQLHGTLV